MKKLFNYLFKENPMITLAIGLFPILAITTTFEKSYIMGVIVLIILLISNLLISFLKRLINNKAKLFISIIIVSIIITIIEFLLYKYCTPLYNNYGIYLPLLVIDSIILDRAISYSYKNNISNSIKDAFKNGIAFLIIISIVGFIRELLGNGTITFMNDISNITGYRSIVTVFNNNMFPNKLFLTSGGAFIILGILIGIINSILKRGEK